MRIRAWKLPGSEGSTRKWPFGIECANSSASAKST